MVKKIYMKIAVLCSLVLMILAVGNTAFALVNPKSFYNSISWTWEYSAPASTKYNCLGYATGSMTWEWPWSKEPTSEQVTKYLKKKGYIASSKYPEIISYGPSKNKITHFSKVTGKEWCRAKWGSLERFNHHSYNPYHEKSLYGKKIQIYSKK